MELAEGYDEDRSEALGQFLSRFRVLWPDRETAWRAGQISRSLRQRGESIGDRW